MAASYVRLRHLKSNHKTDKVRKRRNPGQNHSFSYSGPRAKK